MTRTRATRGALALILGLTSSAAWAQSGPTAQPGAAGGGVPTISVQPGVPADPSQPGSTYVPMPGGAAGGYGGNPQSANGTIGGGNATESSSHPVTGDEEDSFDLGRPAGGGAGSAHGGSDGPIFIAGTRHRTPGGVTGEVPSSHVVRRGDTLWGICDDYFKNPYQWPRIWSYNPQLKNPNWIYPGDELWLESPSDRAAGPARTSSEVNGLNLVDRRRGVPNGTVFLRDQGWIHDESDDIWGEITGAPTDKMFLADPDEVYLTIKRGHDIRLGQQLTIFRTRTSAAAGAIVQVLGTVLVDDWNERERTARARIIETLDVIERGAKIGPVSRTFTIVRPLRDDTDVQAHVLASLHPNEFFGQNEVVFIDKGEAAGLKPGNRLFVMRRGDAWRQTLLTADMSYRVSADDERPMPPSEKTPGSDHDDTKYPDEFIAELRVVDVKKESAACLVTQSKVEIELHDLVVARKGY
jgi:hypothetical protein